MPKDQTLSIADFGLKPDTRKNAVPFVQKALAACTEGAVLVFPKGRYDFWPHHCIERDYFESNTEDINPKRLAILIENKDGLTLDGGGGEFVFHDRMQPFTIDNSRTITLCNLSIDWDIPLLAQAKVVQITDTYADLQINAYESPYVIENGKIFFTGEGWKSGWWGTVEFDGETKNAVTADRDLFEGYRAEALSKELLRLHGVFKSGPRKGSLLVLRHSKRDHAAVFIIDSKNITLEDMRIHHCAGLGILSQYAEDLHFANVHCIPNEARGRILSGHDDGLHFSNCRGTVSVDNCSFHALMDDPINVHGTAVRVIERMSDTVLRCKFMHHESLGLHWARAGEQVGFIKNETMQTIGLGIVQSFKVLDTELFELSFETALPKEVAPGDALENRTWTCDVSIKNSRFKSCRARGILISTPGKVVIENNVFESHGAAILIPGDANNWYESGAVKDVLITKNIFKAPCLTFMYQFCEGIISIMPEIPQKTAETPPFHRNIIIRDNEFHPFDYPVLYALSVEGIEFSGNRLIRSHEFKPWHPRKDGLTFEWCKKVTVKNNAAEDDVLGRTICLRNTPEEECTIDWNGFTVLTY
ncbi:alpha-1,3-galactosidase B [Spirochaetia bacterium]|nr:alpha-1,3-galactosidase B [Spirochaetia bacterium]